MTSAALEDLVLHRYNSLVANALEQLLDLHASIEQDLDAQLASIASKEADAHRIIAQCFETRQRIDRERAGLKDAARIYQDAFGAGTNGLQNEKSDPTTRLPIVKPVLSDNLSSLTMSDAHILEQQQVRARIGPQRFLMLDAINTMTHLRIEDIITLTRLPYRRIKDQMVSDVRAGMVFQSGDLYSLTSSGMDLLTRYKAYKRAHGQTLPTADELYFDDKRDDIQSENQVNETVEESPMDSEVAERNAVIADYSIADDDGRITDRSTQV